VLIGNDFEFPFPAVDAAADLPPGAGLVEPLTLRFIFERGALPDGTEIHKGTGKLTLLVRDGKIVAMLAGSVQLDPGAAIVVRAKDGPIDLPGHRGTLGKLHFGGAIVKEDAVIGLAAASSATLDGVTVSTQRRAVSYAFTAPDGYSLGAGAVVVGTPSDRAVRIEGNEVDVRTPGKRTRIVNGGIVVEGGRVRETLAGAQVESFTDLPEPAPRDAHAADLTTGKLMSFGAEPDASVVVNGVSYLDVTEGTVGDCFFVAALLAVAHSRPDLIEQAILANGDGTYSVRFFDNRGMPVHKVVDADFYVATGPVFYNIYARSADVRELWGPLMEKALASAKSDGFETLDAGGFSDDALELLTGKRTESWQTVFSSKNAIYEIVQDAVRRRKPIVAATGSVLSLQTEELAEVGLVDSHAYCILGTEEEGGQRYVVVRNPWGNFEFNAADYSSDVDVNLDGVPDGDDGTFRMTIEDFCEHFRKVSVLQL
jgi:hypothetical protein